MRTIKSSPVLRTVDVRHSYTPGEEVLHGVDVGIPRGALTVISGPSGSGKTTLLNTLAGIIVPTEGEVFHRHRSLKGLSPDELTEWRGEHTGYGFQQPGLIASWTVARNILSLHERANHPIDREWAASLCAQLGISSLLKKYPVELSGGQQQRASLARALVHKPDILFADEPTGNLDAHTTEEVQAALGGLVANLDVTVAMVSHDPVPGQYVDQIIRMHDGLVEEAAYVGPTVGSAY